MTSIFDKYSDLDPALMRKQVEVAHGAPIFDQYSHDDVRAEAQMHAAIAAQFDHYSILDPELEMMQIDAALQGGPSTDWVTFSGSAWVNANGTHWVTA